MFQAAAVSASSSLPTSYAPPTVNFTTGGGTPSTTSTDEVAGTASVDPRRYSQFDRTASNVGDASMSFGDFLDMINPLQHIPVVSSVYRAVTGDTINPVSHVAGDIMYGGVFGVAAALAGGVGAIADTAMEEKTGKGMIGTVYAELFGDDKAAAGDGSIQLASATSVTPTQPSSTPTAPDKKTETLAAILSNDPAKAAAAAGQGIPLTRNNKAYGGVLAPQPAKDMQAQNMAMAVASATGIRIGNTVYANRLASGGRALPAAPAPAPSQAAAASVPSTDQGQVLITALPQTQINATPVPTSTSPLMSLPATSTTPVAPASVATSTNIPTEASDEAGIPPALRDDALVMRALGLYQNVAASAKKPGIN